MRFKIESDDGDGVRIQIDEFTILVSYTDACQIVKDIMQVLNDDVAMALDAAAEMASQHREMWRP